MNFFLIFVLGICFDLSIGDARNAPTWSAAAVEYGFAALWAWGACYIAREEHRTSEHRQSRASEHQS